jgi:hypothetical protein
MQADLDQLLACLGMRRIAANTMCLSSAILTVGEKSWKLEDYWIWMVAPRDCIAPCSSSTASAQETIEDIMFGA